jgi:acetyl-CoA C-acetyltransferase
MSGNKRICLLTGSRTPIGKFGRTLKRIGVDKLAEHVFLNAIRKAKISGNDLDGIVLGHAYQSAYTPNTARFSALNAGIPASIPAMTVQRQCGSGMEAVNIVMKDIMLGNGELYLAGGAESMSSVPYLLPGTLRFQGYLAKYFRFGPRPIIGLADDGLVPMRLHLDMKTTYMAGTAQRLADTYKISREQSDEYALRSHKLACAAIKSGRFQIEIDPIIVGSKSFFEEDEHPRDDTTIEKLSAMKPDPRLKTRSITAGNSSGINDGACAVIISSEEKASQLGIEPIAYLTDSCVVGVDPDQMGIGPVIAIEALLKRNNLSLADIDLFEINEAFACQYLACEKLLQLDRNKVNVNGGAIALGHPIAMSGTRLILTLAQELKLRNLKRGIASLCIGGGMGIATLIERE